MDRPFVYVNMAMTADGKITSVGREYPRFTSPHDKRTMDRLRSEADAVLLGAGTLRADDPPLSVRDPELRAHRQALGKPALVGIVVSRSLCFPPASRFFEAADGGARIVATIDAAPLDRVAALERQAEVWRLGPASVDLVELVGRLRERGVGRLLVEGGGDLNWGFFSAGLVDELYVTIAPTLLGGSGAPTLLEGAGWPMARQRRLRLADLAREGDELYCRYVLEP